MYLKTITRLSVHPPTTTCCVIDEREIAEKNRGRSELERPLPAREEKSRLPAPPRERTRRQTKRQHARARARVVYAVMYYYTPPQSHAHANISARAFTYPGRATDRPGVRTPSGRRRWRRRRAAAGTLALRARSTGDGKFRWSPEPPVAGGQAYCKTRGESAL